MTDTMHDTLTLTPGTLTLVRVTHNYLGTADAYADAFTREADDDALTFYATTSELGGDWATLIVPDADPRSRGFWALHHRDHLRAVEGHGAHRGWNIRREFLVPVVDEEPDPTRPPSADLDESHRRDLPIAEAYPIGTIWQHVSYSEPVTIDGYNGDHYVRIQRGPDGTGANEWPRGALDAYGTYVGRVDTPVDESSSEPETFTRADVDRLVAEARAEADAALEAFKEEANRIAVQYAKDNDLCGNFERCMADIGLMGREEWDNAHKVTRYVVFRVPVEVSADEDSYAVRYEASEWLAERYASTIVDSAVEVLDDDGDTIWES